MAELQKFRFRLTVASGTPFLPRLKHGGLLELFYDSRGQALTLGNLALLAKDMGDAPTAMDLGEQALDKFRTLGDKQNLMVGLANLSGTALRIGRRDRVGEFLRESLDLCTQLGSKINLTYVLSGTARLAYAGEAYALCIRLRAAAAGLR